MLRVVHCLLVSLCFNPLMTPLRAAVVTQEQIHSRLERMARDLLSEVELHEFVSDDDAQVMHHELGELLLKNKQFELAGEVLAQISEEHWGVHALTYSEASRKLLKQYYSQAAIRIYLRIREQKLASRDEDQLSADERSHRKLALDELDAIRTFQIDQHLIDLKFDLAIEQIELLQQPAYQIDYWLQLFEVERKSGSSEEIAKRLDHVEDLLDTFIRSEWKEYVDTDADAPKDISFPIVKLWETSNVPEPILDRLSYMHRRMHVWLYRLSVELRLSGAITSAEYLNGLVKDKFLHEPDYFTGETTRKAISDLLNGNYARAAKIYHCKVHIGLLADVVRALILRGKLIQAEEFVRLVRDWDGLRLLANEYSRRGDITKVRQFAEALRAHQQLPGSFVPETAIRLLRQGKLVEAKQYLKNEWEKWLLDVVRWEKRNQEGYDWATDNPIPRVDIECLFIQAFFKAGDLQSAKAILNRTLKYVQAIPPDAEFAGYDVHHRSDVVHFRSDACSELGKTAALLGQAELARYLFNEALSFDRPNRIEILLDMAAASFLEEFRREVNQIHTTVDLIDEDDRRKWAEYDVQFRRRLNQRGFRAYHKTKAEQNPEKVEFKAIEQYDDPKIRFYAELGMLEGLISARN